MPWRYVASQLVGLCYRQGMNIRDCKMESEACAFLHILEQIPQDRQNVRLVTRGLRLSNTHKESGRTSSRRSIERGSYEGSI